MQVFMYITIALLTGPAIVAVAFADAISSGLPNPLEASSSSLRNHSPYGSEFFILNTNFQHQFQFVDLNTKDRELTFDLDTNKQVELFLFHVSESIITTRAGCAPNMLTA